MLARSHIQSKLLSGLPGLIHGFTSKEMPQSLREEIIDNVAIAKQVHKDNLIWVNAVEKEIREADAVATFTAGVPVGVFSADCVPTLIVAQDTSTQKVYGALAIHGSWRCTSMKLPAQAFSALAKQAHSRWPQRPTLYYAVIGPCISFESFEVHDDVLQEFPEAEANGLAKYTRTVEGRRKYLIDLPGETLRQLRAVAEQGGLSLQTENLNLCTVKNPHLFPSHRRRDRKPMGGILSYLGFDSRSS